MRYPPIVATRVHTPGEAPLRRAPGRPERARSPARPAGATIARSACGRAWCEHIAGLGDFAGRMRRAAEYALAGAVTDLHLGPGRISAEVEGTRRYRQTIVVQPLLGARRDALLRLLARGPLARCAADELRPLFPALPELAGVCTCPDRADVCKHILAALLAVGVRLDESPALLLLLRGVEPADAPPRPLRARVRRRWLRSLGISAPTIDGWLRRGVLLRTRERGVYRRTSAADRKLSAYLDAAS